METKKIALACFIGGALCCAVTFMIAPLYWWFGLLAGLAGGYISYDFFNKGLSIAFSSINEKFVRIYNKWIQKNPAYILFYSVWKYSAIKLRSAISLYVNINLSLLYLFHSKKLLLCTSDGIFGGAISYFCFYSAAITTTEHILFTVLGGLLGVITGITTWKSDSQHLLHIASK